MRHIARYLRCFVHQALCAAMLLALTAGLAAAARAVPTSSGPQSELILRETRLAVSAERVDLAYQLDIRGLAFLRDQLRDGAHIDVTGGIRLFQKNLLRPNSELATLALQWTLRHEPLTRTFLLITPGGQSRRAPHLDVLLHEAWRELHATLRPAEALEKDEEYLLALELVVRYAEVPPWLERALFFWSWELSPRLTAIFPFTFPPQ